MNPCKALDCDSPGSRGGWCPMHHTRIRRHGSPDVNKQHKASTEPCAVEGCSTRASSRGWCEKHYTRWLRHGDPLTVHEYPGVTMHSEGYRLVRRNGHVLADAKGYVAEHRLVLWEQLNGADSECHWCSMPIRWDHAWPKYRDALVVDHLDDDKLNNDPANLAPSCNPCNSTRAPNRGRYTPARRQEPAA